MYLKKLSFEFPNDKTRGSNHKALVLFLLTQTALIKDFNYFDQEALGLFANEAYIHKLFSEIMNDYSSSTNQAIIINSFYLC